MKTTLTAVFLSIMLLSGCNQAEQTIDPGTTTTVSKEQNENKQNEITHKEENTVRINEYHGVKCSPNGDLCDDVIIALEVDTQKDSYGEKLVGFFYIRAYLDKKKIGEIQITQNARPMNGDGTTIQQKDEYKLLVLKQPFDTNYAINYHQELDGTSHPGYTLHIQNLEFPSSFNNRQIDFYYDKEKSTMKIGFPQ